MPGQAGVEQDGVLCSPALLLSTFLSAWFPAARRLFLPKACIEVVSIVWQGL